ncbi:uncharacterized protein LOC111326552 [Stylophora pistillata]|uniref:uncharacterized protein LOC111326552 n=1 Tax=Stylophora pistillata TaxID=50429 RepID=UPI000C03A939|nr:uncharacterized protein LOC111326552 [Stylophora pistillata]
MSNLELLHAGFSAIFGEGGLPSSNIDELFEATYTMMQPFTSQGASRGSFSLKSRMIDVFVFGLQGEIFTVRALNTHTVRELKAIIEEKTGIDAKMMSLTYGGKTLDDTGEASLSSLGICHGSSVFLVLRLRGGGLPGDINPSGLDPPYNFDFSDFKVDGEKDIIGGHQYHPPYGWNRIAVKALSKYGEGDSWLGPDGIRIEGAPNEWAVSYHGMNIENADKIIKEGYKPGPGDLFGKGNYSSPSLKMVEKGYTQPFTHKGKSYNIAFQNRVNPGRVKIFPPEKNTC